ncbi:helix-turn-helix domain-containing protein [Streptomyces sp. NPDC054933]
MVQAWTSESAVEMGRRIQRLRQERGLSLSELARCAGIGKATLSGLESGRRNPTLETLYAITGQLGVPLAALLTAEGETAATGRAVAAIREVRGAAVTARLLEVFDDAAATTELYWLTIEPGRVQRSPAHPPGVVEQLTVVAGVARVGPHDAEVLVRVGEHTSWRADVPHTYAAATGEVVQASLLIRQPRAASNGTHS